MTVPALHREGEEMRFYSYRLLFHQALTQHFPIKTDRIRKRWD